LSRGEKISWETTGNDGKAKQAKRFMPEWVSNQGDATMPLAALRDALSSQEKGRRFLFEHATAALTAADVQNKIPHHLEESFTSCLGDSELLTRDPAGALLGVRDVAKARMNSARATAKAAQQIIDKAGQGLAPMPTVAQLEEAERAVRDWQAPTTGATIPELVQEREVIVGERAKLLVEYQAIEETYRLDIPTPDRHRVAAALLLLARLKETGSTHCGLCAQGVPDGHWDARAMAIQAAIDAAKMPMRHAALITEAKRLTVSIDALSAHIESLGVHPSQAAHVRRAETPDPSSNLAQLQHLAGQWDAIGRARSDASEHNAKAVTWKELENTCSDAIRDLLNTAVEDFQAAVQKHLLKTDVFQIRVWDQGREVLQFGLLRNDVLYTALSGVEWVRVTMAMAAVICKGNDLAVIIPEDRSWDPKTLADVMRSLTKAEAQIILVSAVKQKGRTPAGWTVIEVTAVAPDTATTGVDTTSNGADTPSSEVTWETAFGEGVAAAKLGTGKNDGPYTLGTPAAGGWYSGWCSIMDNPTATTATETPAPETAPTATLVDLQMILEDLGRKPGLNDIVVPGVPGRTGSTVRTVLAAHMDPAAWTDDKTDWINKNVHWGRQLLALHAEQHLQVPML
jgi:hypothetical protein